MNSNNKRKNVGCLLGFFVGDNDGFGEFIGFAVGLDEVSNDGQFTFDCIDP